jgi:hypothetical protein
MSQTVFILPETSDTTLCLRLTGTVTAGDYMQYFDEPVKRIADTNGWYNLYVYHDDDFTGWSAEAADLSFRCISEYSPRARRLAYVNAPDSRMLLMKMLGPMMKAEIRFFDADQRQEAMDWMLSYTP